MTTTERSPGYFDVKAHHAEERINWITFVPRSDDLSILQNGFLGFDLPEGTTYEQAEAIAEFLNKNIVSISYTDLDNPGLHIVQ